LPDLAFELSVFNCPNKKRIDSLIYDLRLFLGQGERNWPDKGLETSVVHRIVLGTVMATKSVMNPKWKSTPPPVPFSSLWCAIRAGPVMFGFSPAARRRSLPPDLGLCRFSFDLLAAMFSPLFISARPLPCDVASCDMNVSQRMASESNTSMDQPQW
jgi:hypothetical protein